MLQRLSLGEGKTDLNLISDESFVIVRTPRLVSKSSINVWEICNLKGKRHTFVLSISCCIDVNLVYTKFYFPICTKNSVFLSNKMAFDFHLTSKQPTKSNVYILVWTWLQYFTNSPQRVFVLHPRPITSRFRPFDSFNLGCKSEECCGIWKRESKQKGRKLKIDESTFLVTKTKRDLLHLFTYPRKQKLQPSKSKIHTKYILHLHY